ncbi:uncharacterized protein FPRO_02049 [Fusarium proliferatum ET1]|uniref:Uncharacterized protein n=1 Tax=Fusarium proliferatum (strain ET1) TaxID=1227346 RepID=A0A1L7V3M7_FUSPR|nr:uncharacterized protein FPRO_02049 [Fusarium proliferatum ET1]CZR32227.1 uncharacterized protein FPRO_02049 [Fusarium proliferatum ET1]
MKFFTLTILAMVSGTLAMPVAAPDLSYAGLEKGAKPHVGPYKPDRPCLPSQQCRGKN